MKNALSQAVKDATAWLLLAYSLGHPQDCSCDRCAEARKITDDSRTEAA